MYFIMCHSSFQPTQLTLNIPFFNPSNAEAIPKHRDAEFSENHLIPVMLVFIGYLLLSTLLLVPIARVHHFEMAKLATSSVLVYSHVMFTSSITLLH